MLESFHQDNAPVHSIFIEIVKIRIASARTLFVSYLNKPILDLKYCYEFPPVFFRRVYLQTRNQLLLYKLSTSHPSFGSNCPSAPSLHSSFFHIRKGDNT